jgi:transcriptional regulator EpsA
MESSPHFDLSTEDGAVLLRIFSEALRVDRHYDLFRWLSGDLQRFLPHSVLISAWGDFARRKLMFDVVSALPGVRTGALRHCRIDELVLHCHAEWRAAARQPLVMALAGAAMAPPGCACSIHGALREARSLLVHGFRDARSGHESLYICCNPASFTRGRCKQAFLTMVPLLVGPIDAACRRVAALPHDDGQAGAAKRGDPFELTAREQEIVLFLCEGKSNAAIAATLGISLFTVKNHLKHIFEKMGAGSRAEVVATHNRHNSPARWDPPTGRSIF